MYTIYLTGPISGLSYDECLDHFEKRKFMLEQGGYKIIHPMLGKEHLRNEIELKAQGYVNSPISSNHSIVKTDFWRVDQSDILYNDLTLGKDRVSIGTVSEMSRAYAKDKLIITVMQKENIHQHAFIIEMSSLIFETNEEALDYFFKIK